MKKYKHIIIGTLMVFLGSYGIGISNAHAETLILFDASGSMQDQFDGVTRLEAAKKSVYDFITSLSDESEVGLRLYAHKNHAGNQVAACSETELVQDFTTNHSSIISKVAETTAVGSYTPTAYALQQTKNDFTAGEENTLILLTDGKETCNGDPVQVAKELCEAGINVKTYVIGLGVDSDTKGQLQSIASAGCGQYFDATDTASLASSFSALSTVVEEPIDRSRTTGTAVRGGSQISNAVELQPGPGVFHLDHHQKKAEYDYFYITMRPGESYYISAGLSEYEVQYDRETNTFVKELKADEWLSHESEGQISVLSVYNDQETSIGKIKADSYQDVSLDYGVLVYNADKSVTYQERRDIERGDDGENIKPHPLVGNFDRLYFKIGNDNSEMHKLVPFTIERKSIESTNEPVVLDEASSTVANNADNSGANPSQLSGMDMDSRTILMMVGAGIGLLLLILVIVLIVMLTRRRPDVVAEPVITSSPVSTPETAISQNINQ